jgi:hypothetical protein
VKTIGDFRGRERVAHEGEKEQGEKTMKRKAMAGRTSSGCAIDVEVSVAWTVRKTP